MILLLLLFNEALCQIEKNQKLILKDIILQTDKCGQLQFFQILILKINIVFLHICQINKQHFGQKRYPEKKI